jgi:hypothetical protein
LKARTQGIGSYTLDEGIQWGATGPNLRAWGFTWDFRKWRPYSGYEQFEFDIPTAEHGDCYDRGVVRVEEMRQSLRIIEQCLNNMPAGPYKADHHLTTRPGLTCQQGFLLRRFNGIQALKLRFVARHPFSASSTAPSDRNQTPLVLLQKAFSRLGCGNTKEVKSLLARLLRGALGRRRAMSAILPRGLQPEERGDSDEGDKNILVAVDDSEASDRTVTYVAQMVDGRREFHILLFHVPASMPPQLLEFGGAEVPVQEQRAEAELSNAQAAWVEEVTRPTRTVSSLCALCGTAWTKPAAAGSRGDTS